MVRDRNIEKAKKVLEKLHQVAQGQVSPICSYKLTSYLSKCGIQAHKDRNVLHIVVSALRRAKLTVKAMDRRKDGKIYLILHKDEIPKLKKAMKMLEDDPLTVVYGSLY